VRFGEPIHVAGEYDGVPPGRARREITDRVMEGIQRLTGQETAGVYNERPAET
jgi:1-acyl-sn-glycerol-3-phosphate acyltransferase